MTKRGAGEEDLYIAQNLNIPPLTKGRSKVGLILTGSLNKPKNRVVIIITSPVSPSLVRRGAIVVSISSLLKLPE